LLKEYPVSEIIQCPEALLQLDRSGKVVLITGGYSGIALS
jgi:hypothetical protein